MKSGAWVRTARALLVGALFVTMAAGCGSTPVAPSASASAPGAKPTVVVQSPANGAVVAVGQDLAVTGAASDTVGVDHVALFADGVSVASSPSGQPAPLVPFSLTWLATPAGPHTLQVIAYRADGTPSDPAVISVVVGTGSFPIGSGVLPFPSASSGGLITPPPTKKPKPSKTPRPMPTPAPTTAGTEAPTPTPTPTPTTLPTMDASGNAPDDLDNEPYEISLTPDNTACPPIDTGAPVTATGCIWEQISAPAGDTSDDLEFTQAPDTWYHMVLTSCSDTSDATVWGATGDSSSTLGCMDSMDKKSSGGNPGSFPITVYFPSTVTSQTYNLYQLTVYQCGFANCANQ